MVGELATTVFRVQGTTCTVDTRVGITTNVSVKLQLSKIQVHVHRRVLVRSTFLISNVQCPMSVFQILQRPHVQFSSTFFKIFMNSASFFFCLTKQWFYEL